MKDVQWRCDQKLKLVDWGEADAIVYLKGSGDIHVVTGLIKEIIGTLLCQPMTLRCLERNLAFNLSQDFDSDYIRRQIAQLSSLGLVFEATQ